MLKNKMAAIDIFPIIILSFLTHSYCVCVIATVFNLSGEIRYKRCYLKILFLECVYVYALAWWATITFGSLQHILFYIDLSNFQYSV